ncbi:MAG: response regulator transcription factor [Alkalinema sp. RL_2_19]|nr:response regulator transcription factor [Alkalinema sp. RL_2_19]
MPLTILVADDDLGTRLSVTDYLELHGFAAVAAKNGREALAKVEECRPHLIVTDIAMPQVDGHAFVRQIRSQPALRLLPVVFLTARDETADRIMGYQLGCDAYLAKPFELEELLAVVRNLLDRAQSVALEMQFSRSQTPTERQLSSPAHGHERHGGESAAEQPAVPQLAVPQLTVRELQVLSLISSGGSNIQIGKDLHLSPRTIEKHVSSLLRKTDMHNRSELVRYAIEHNLVN